MPMVYRLLMFHMSGKLMTDNQKGKATYTTQKQENEYGSGWYHRYLTYEQTKISEEPTYM